MTIRRIFSLLFFFAALYVPVAAQDDDDGYRMELGAAVGGSFYLGDANSGFYSQTKAAGAVVARYLLNPRMAFKGMLSLGGIGGNTNAMNQFYPEDPTGGISPTPRSYTFSGNVVDFGITYEYNFWGYSFFEGFEGYHRLTPYIQIGLGITYADTGKQFTGNIPIGIGLKYKLGRRWNIGLDWSYHFSFSDKLDGLYNAHGMPTSGFKNRDDYALTMVYLTYDISPKCVTCNKD